MGGSGGGGGGGGGFVQAVKSVAAKPLTKNTPIGDISVGEAGAVAATGGLAGSIGLGLKKSLDKGGFLNPEGPKVQEGAAGGPPTPGDAQTSVQVEKAADQERKTAKGRAATLLTGGTGLTDTVKTSKRTLLGS